MSDLETRPVPDTDAGALAPASTPAEAESARASTSGRRRGRRSRISKWDRPGPPKDWRFWVGNLGRTLIAIGLLMFGFVAYQLWGTGIEQAQAQNRLETEFQTLLEATGAGAETGADETFGDGNSSRTPGAVADPTNDAPGATTGNDAVDDVIVPGSEVSGEGTAAPIPVEQQNLPPVVDGDAIARLQIPDIGVDEIVVAGVDTGDLKRGPGHFPDTPLPGQVGNAAIAGHRTTYGEPFRDVDQLEPGDEIIVTTLNGTFTYAVTGTRIVEPSDYQVVATTDPTRASLTLTSCHPKWTAQQRIVIFSDLIASQSAAVGEPVLNYGRPEVAPGLDELPDERPAGGDSSVEVVDGDTASGNDGAVSRPSASTTASGSGSVTGSLIDDPLGSPSVTTPSASTDFQTAAVSAGIADAFGDGWFSDPGANLQVGLWGLLLALLGVGAYLISRKVRRDWVGAMVALAPFAVALYFFFQNVNRLLPPNL